MNWSARNVCTAWKSGYPVILVVFLASTARSGETLSPTLSIEETPQNDARSAQDPNLHTAADPIHPWDGNDLTDTLDNSGTVHNRPKVLPEDPHQLSEQRELTKASAPGTRPESIGFVRNLPNPFNAQTRIEFALEQAGPAVLEVYNLLGQVQARVEWKNLEAGTHSWLWAGRLSNGQPAASGVYFYRLEVRDASAIGRMVLLK